ncbi:hypothetical protein VPH35_085363 [Triticum aestivum]
MLGAPVAHTHTWASHGPGPATAAVYKYTKGKQQPMIQVGSGKRQRRLLSSPTSCSSPSSLLNSLVLKAQKKIPLYSSMILCNGVIRELEPNIWYQSPLTTLPNSSKFLPHFFPTTTTMNSELKAYLDKLHAETRAQYAEIHKQLHLQDALLTKPSTGARPPPLTRSAEGISIDTIPEVVTDAFSATTHAQKAPAVTHDAAPICIATAPVTCSTECSTQVDAIVRFNEAHEAATTIRLGPLVDLVHQEVEQLAPVQATASIRTGTPSTVEVVPPVAAITDVDPKASVQERDDSPLPSINTLTPAATEMDHIMVLIVSSSLTALAPTKCSTEYAVHVGDWVKPLFALSMFYATYAPSSLTHLDHLEPLRHPSQIAQAEYGTHLVDKSKNWGLSPLWQGIEQPWPPPSRVRIGYMGHLFRPRPWPSLRYHSDACYPEERCSGISSHAHEVSWFFPWLVLLLFRNVVFLQVSCCEMIPMEEAVSFQSVEILQHISDDPRLLLWSPTSAESLVKTVVQEILCNGILHIFSGNGRAVQGYDGTKLRPRPWPLFEINQETIQLKLQRTIFPGNCQAVHAVFEQYLCGQLYLNVLSMSVYEKILNHMEIQGSGHFSTKCSSLWDLLSILIVWPICCCEQPFSYLQGAHSQFWRPLEGAAYFCDRVTCIAEHGKMGSEGTQRRQVNCENLLTCASYMVLLLEGTNCWEPIPKLHWRTLLQINQWWRRKMIRQYGVRKAACV